MSPMIAGLNIPITDLAWLMALGSLGGVLILTAFALAWRKR